MLWQMIQKFPSLRQNVKFDYKLDWDLTGIDQFLQKDSISDAESKWKMRCCQSYYIHVECRGRLFQSYQIIKCLISYQFLYVVNFVCWSLYEERNNRNHWTRPAVFESHETAHNRISIKKSFIGARTLYKTVSSEFFKQLVTS